MHGLRTLLLGLAILAPLPARASDVLSQMRTQVFDTPANFILGENLAPLGTARPADPFAAEPSVES